MTLKMDEYNFAKNLELVKIKKNTFYFTVMMIFLRCKHLTALKVLLLSTVSEMHMKHAKHW